MPTKYSHQHQTLAKLAQGLSALLGPISLLLIVSLPIIFFVPLLTTNFWFFMQTNITLAHAVSDLFRIDRFLFVVVVVFGILFPFIKAAMSVLCWYHFEISKAGRYLEALSYVATLSMLDIMLLAFFVVAFKGVGIGTVHVRYGLYIYASLVMASLFLNLAMTPVAKRIQLRQNRTSMQQQET
jgi:paraquat-inducible protein A